MISAVISSFSEAIAALFQSFRLAFVLPAFLFWVLNVVFIFPTLPQTGYIKWISDRQSSSQLALMVALSFLLGYFLMIINIWLIRLFEGYHWNELWFAQALIKKQTAEKDNLEAPLLRFKELEQIIADPSTRTKEFDKAVAELFSYSRHGVTERIQELNERFPMSGRKLLPTSLGNRIAAFEDYPYNRYEIDAVALWPRLLPILSKNKLALFIEREKANLDFLLNLCFLLLIFSLEALCAAISFPGDWVVFCIASGVAIQLAYGLYKLSLLGASGWGMSVRVAFDLYRYDLLAILYGRSPLDFDDERHIWRDLSRFFKEGNNPIDNFDYKKIGKFVQQSGLSAKDETGSSEAQMQQGSSAKLSDSVRDDNM